MKLAALPPYGVLCELINPDGSMARLLEIFNFAEHHRLPLLAAKDLIDYQQARH